MTPTASKHRILVVDDDEIVRKVVERILLHHEYDVETIASGELACERMQTTKFDLMITDIRMPGMSGIELITKCKALNSKCAIMVITGAGTMELLIEASRAGASDFVLKPIEMEDLIQRVENALEKKRLSDTVADQMRQLVQSEKMATVGLLATGIAHEINNPTTFIRTNLQLLREYIKRLQPRLENLDDEKNKNSVKKIITEEFPQIIEEALEGTDRIQKIVAGVKHYAYTEEGGGGAPVDIRDVITHAVTLVRSRLRRNITITESYLNIQEIVGHFSKLEQVFVNLLVNSADAISEKMEKMSEAERKSFSGLIDVSATIISTGEEEIHDEILLLTFYDNGNGIPETKRGKVFDPFFTTKALGKGTGLGLYICHEIITQHGGELTVQSQPGEGTAFIIKLPVKGKGAGKTAPRPQS